MRSEDEVVTTKGQGEALKAERLRAHHDVERHAKALTRQTISVGDDDIEVVAHW
jgi:hypothetical protein